MGPAQLSPDEFAAIQNVVGAPAAQEGVSALSLSADERAAAQATPILQALADAWARHATGSLELVIANCRITTLACEVVDGKPLGEEVRAMWAVSLRCAEAVPAVIAAGGSLVSVFAARALGDTRDEDINQLPSATAIQLFAPAGRALAAAFLRAWKEVLNKPLEFASDAATVAQTTEELATGEVVMAATLALDGSVAGRLRILAHPHALQRADQAQPRTALAGNRVNATLGPVPVELQVELGRLPISMDELERLTVGEVITLPSFIDDVVPIRCAGVIKGYGKPIVDRGALAVEVTAVAPGRGGEGL